MVTGMRRARVRAAVTPIAVLDVVPDFRAFVAHRAVVLGPSQEPRLILRVLGEILELSDAETLVERLPGDSRIGRPEDAAVTADVDHIRIYGTERDRVLIRVDRVAAALGRDGQPTPGAPAGSDAAVRVDGAQVDHVRIIRSDGDEPVIPRLSGPQGGIGRDRREGSPEGAA